MFPGMCHMLTMGYVLCALSSDKGVIGTLKLSVQKQQSEYELDEQGRVKD